MSPLYKLRGPLDIKSYRRNSLSRYMWRIKVKPKFEQVRLVGKQPFGSRFVGKICLSRTYISTKEYVSNEGGSLQCAELSRC